jgi:predicted Ser/Thr protein kinase
MVVETMPATSSDERGRRREELSAICEALDAARVPSDETLRPDTLPTHRERGPEHLVGPPSSGAPTFSLDASPPQGAAEGDAPFSEKLGFERGVQDPDRMSLVVGDHIAHGGMGQIWAAEQTSLGREVAVKTLLTTRRSDKDVRMLLREARITGRLEHPNIVPVHGLGHSAVDGPYLVMKRIEGTPWRDLLRDQPPRNDEELRRRLEVLMEVCQAVEFAHSRGVIHRDIKPANVMVGAFGEVYLLDWGIAVHAGQEGEGGGAGPDLVGTPAYMAPEMVDGAAVTPQTDVYLLGATLHELLVGQPRHIGPDIDAVVAAAWASLPHEYAERVPAGLGAIANRACAVRPEDRYPTVAALRQAIVDFLRHRSSFESTRAGVAGLRLLQQLLADAAASGARRTREVHVEIRRVFSAARFNLEQALRDWDENLEAREALQHGMELMIVDELASGDHDAAANLLKALPTTNPALAARVGAAQEEAASSVDAREALAAMRREMRVGGSDWGRAAVTLFNGFAVGFLLFSLSLAMRLEMIVPTPRGTLLALIAGMGANGIALIGFRRVLLDSAMYRRLMAAYTAMLGILVVGAVAAWLGGLTYEQSLIGYGLICTAIPAGLAATVDRRFWIHAGLGAASTCVVACYPSLDVIALAFVLAAGASAWMVRPGQDNEKSQEFKALR